MKYTEEPYDARYDDPVKSLERAYGRKMNKSVAYLKKLSRK